MDEEEKSSKKFLELRKNPALIIPILAVLFVPLYRTPVLENSFITPKVGVMAVLTFFGIVIGILSRSFKNLQINNVMSFGILGLSLLSIVSVAWASSVPLAIYGCAVISIFLVYYFVVIISLKRIQDVKLVLTAGSFAAVLTAAWAVAEDYGFFTGAIVGRLPDWRGKLSAGLGNSGHIAGFIGLFLPWLIVRFITDKKLSLLRFIGILICFAAMVVTWSVGSTGAFILSMGIFGVICLLIKSIRDKIFFKRISSIIIGGVAVTAWYFIPHGLNPHNGGIYHEAFSSQRWADGWPTRVVIWETTWSVISHHPIRGVGIGNFTYEFVQQHVESVLSNPALRGYAGMFTNDAHNDYLQLWSELGIGGFAIWGILCVSFLYLVVNGLRQTDWERRQISIAIGIGGCVFFLDSLMSFPVQLPSHLAALMTFFAIAVYIKQSETMNREGKLFSRIGIPVYTLILCSLALYVTSRRIVAEYYLKTARAAVEAEVYRTPMGAMNQWQAADSMYRNILNEIASGNKQGSEPMILAMQGIANSASFAGAEQYLEKALSSDRYYSNASSRLGMLYLMQGRYDDVIRITSDTLKSLQTVEIYERLGAANYFSGNREKAIEVWTLCAKRMPAQADFYKALAAGAALK